MTKKLVFVSIALLLVISIVMIGCQTTPTPTTTSPIQPTAATTTTKQPQDWPKAVIIASGRQGGGVHTIATGMAVILTEELNIKTDASSGEFGKSMVLLHNGEVDFAHAQDDLVYLAARGMGEFEQYGNMNIRTLFTGTNVPGAFFVKANSDIRKVSDLKGKVVNATVPANMSFTRCAEAILSSAGLTLKDIKDMPMGVTEGREALPDGRVDAFFAYLPSVGGAAWAEQIHMTTPLRLIAPEPNTIDAIVKQFAYFQRAIIPAKDYHSLVENRDLESIGSYTDFLCRPDLPDDFVYEVMKVIFKNIDKLATFHPEAIPHLDEPLLTAFAPYHPGAIKYYKEKGMWTTGLDQKQQGLLKDVGASQ